MSKNSFFSKIISIKIGDNQNDPEIEVIIEATIGRSDEEIFQIVKEELGIVAGCSKYLNEKREKSQ